MKFHFSNFIYSRFFFVKQKLQTELTLKESVVRNLVLQGRQDLNTPSTSAPDLAQSLETLVSNWSNLQKKVDTKVAFYTDIFTAHEELKSNLIHKIKIKIQKIFFLDILHQENVWLDTLQNRVFTTSNNGADAEEISEELDVKSINIKSEHNSYYFCFFSLGS